ncbi:hypothetical protein [Flavisolibacter tropicus]|uniref:Glycosyltransferase RgtA/B/C/D-like domain-containing protein n=1 Tax=Flavisolibacter tropicus TaxID=1492898 RepID=A0A172U0D1_9BACT|nr:hypothetical protein [Flavisolibacter tropicus]ANE52447.1 hypothetical protein SY85_20135 [Flavisolibacter tropicus]
MKRTVLWMSFFIVLSVKLITVNYLAGLTFCENPEIKGGIWANTSGDYFSYIGAMENYISQGLYYFNNNNGDKVFAGRMPHYSIPYYLLRQIFSISTSLDLFVLYQVIIESFAIICLALLIFDITKRNWTFYISLLLSLISLYNTTWSFAMITDGLSANYLFISVFFFWRFFTLKSRLSFYLFSIFLALATCLRPYLILFYPVSGLFLFYHFRHSLRKLFPIAFALALPITLLLSPWVIRNYFLFNRVILFQQDVYAGYGYGEDELAIRRLLSILGEDATTFWDKNTAASFFHKQNYKSSDYKYPSYLQRDTTLYRAIEDIRLSYINGFDSKNLTVQKANEIIGTYRSKHPFRFYLLNNIQLVKSFIINSGSYYLPISKSFTCYQPVQWVIKLSQSLLYYIYLIPGFLGLIFGTKYNRNVRLLLFPTIFLIALFPVFFKAIEWRFFLPFYYFHQVGLILLFCLWLSKWPNYKVKYA